MIRNRYPASSLRSREVGYLDENYQKLANAIILQAVKDFRAAYRRLKRFPNVISGYLPEIASGKRSSTEFDIPVKKLGFSKLTWTARELGLNSIFSGGRVTEEAKEAAIAKIAFNIATLNNALLEDYPYLYLMRGDLLLQKGNKKEAEADFEAVIQKDTIADGGSCRQYALLSLGRDKDAEEWMERIIESDPDDAGNYYDKACLLSRMGKLNESIAALRTAFEKGYRSFSHIRLDDDMDAVRDLPEFKALVEEYEAIHSEYLKKSELAIPEKEEEYTEIALKRHPGGTFEIPCDINGLPLQMIFDTGASDVTISSVEANFMLKNGYLSEKDIKGKRYYQIASGELSAGTIITLREVRIGDAVLKNVDASVVKSQKAPLLLGQSAMERFGTITIDNQNNKLIIKH